MLLLNFKEKVTETFQLRFESYFPKSPLYLSDRTIDVLSLKLFAGIAP